MDISRAVHEPHQTMTQTLSVHSNTGKPKKLTLSHIAQAVYQNGNVELQTYEATVVEELYSALVESDYVTQIEDMLEFINFEKDCSCTQEAMVNLLIDRLKLQKWFKSDLQSKLEVLLQRYRLDEKERM